jgi:5-methyltetrahydropteroyltriglutamate--homocysteine methyltransferase
VRIFGIDPGSARTGYGCVETDGRRHRLVTCGAISAPAGDPFPQRLARIHRELSVLLAACDPDCVAIESLFHAAGNFRSSWVASGGYDYVAEALFTRLNVDGFFLEYDDERSGGFAPLRFVPKGKYVVLGLVTSKRGELERKDDLKRRLDEASKFIPLDQLCLSPQCGFSSTVDGNSLTADEQKAKLQLVVDTAREVWG